MTPCSVPRGGFLYTIIVPGRVFAPFKSCPGGLSRGGWFWMKLIPALYIKNARECLAMISKHEKAYEARRAKPRELFIAFECFDIMVKHERDFLI